MKKLILFSALALLFFATVGCDKHECTKDATIKTVKDTIIIRDTITVTVKDTIIVTHEKSKKYEWFISSFGDEEGAGITEQAKHFKVSKVDREKGTYYYQPKDRFVGSDSVKIEVSKGSNGGSRGHITLYKIKFEMTKCGMKVSKTKVYLDCETDKPIYGTLENEPATIKYIYENEEKILVVMLDNPKNNYPLFPCGNSLPKEYQIEGLKVKVSGVCRQCSREPKPYEKIAPFFKINISSIKKVIK